MATGTPSSRITAALAGLGTMAALGLSLTGCVANDNGGATSITVTSSATACTVSKSTAPSGTLHFDVTNTADAVTEFYLLGDDRQSVVGEVENVTPGVKRTLTVRVKPGTYYTECKPGMAGHAVGRAKFTVTAAGNAARAGAPGVARRVDDRVTDEKRAATVQYVGYVRQQAGRLVAATSSFAAAYSAGDDATARSLYPTARAYYERIEPVAESFGNLDPNLDLREADVPASSAWTGWHRIEKDLWPPASAQNGGNDYAPLTAAQRTDLANTLVADTGRLDDEVHDPHYSVSLDAISNGAIGLLDEVAGSKITGEEEIFSHTDLWDFAANVEGAKAAYEGVRGIAASRNAGLVKTIDARFENLQSQLHSYGSLQSGFVPYTDLSTADIKRLSDAVNGLSEPLSTLTAAVLDED